MQVEDDGDSNTDSEEREAADAPQQPDEEAGVDMDIDCIRWERNELEKVTKELAEERTAYQRLVGDITQEYELNMHQATETIVGMRGQLEGLQSEVFQVRDAIERGSVGGNGPYDEDVADIHPTEVRNPTFVYEDARRAHKKDTPAPN